VIEWIYEESRQLLIKVWEYLLIITMTIGDGR
jgi:hypothetical protein